MLKIKIRKIIANELCIIDLTTGTTEGLWFKVYGLWKLGT